MTFATPRDSILHIAKISVRLILMVISVLMVWEALSPGPFTSAVPRPLRDWIEVSYIAGAALSLGLLGTAIYNLASGRRTGLGGALQVSLNAVWLFGLVACSLLMAVRTGI